MPAPATEITLAVRQSAGEYVVRGLTFGSLKG
jgi:hypothetical protein